jgi:hypothetical protein
MRPGIHYTRRALPRLAAADPQQYEVTARIISQTDLDGNPIDTPLVLTADCVPDLGTCGTAMSSDDRAAAAARSAAKAQAGDEARAGGPTGGAGSGGMYPGQGGLPFHVPTLTQGLALALVALGVVFVATERRR